MQDLNGRTVLVTGAARGIGRAIALAAGRAGADVALLDLDADGAAAVAAEIRAIGRRALPLAGDVSDPADRTAALAQLASSALGPPAVLVNNAGIQIVGDPLTVDHLSVRRTMAVNFEAPFFLTLEVARGWVERRVSGAVVNIASIAGAVHFHRHAAYSASKAALRAATGSLALELAPFGIRVNAVAPGHVQTDLSLPRTPAQMAELLARVPLGRLGTPDDIAPVVVFLASSRAAYITGQTVTVDGGFVLQ
ncbi:SDR family oxidoreductase [soil metagenome]